ncbi:ATP-binding cassette domain-containing protein [Nocardioides insulae]|uniref:ATP-binding cassette domain-containing protein n=1 Tax=Nocardioides insulae TaxID=394734 RepID=UPI00056660E8|nr:ATP-binding cassette domain-containing protein [Nocardioides insulae]
MADVGVTLGTARRPVPVLNGVDLVLPRGEVLALLGPNGAGKTTTIRVLTTQLRHQRGQVTVAGVDPLRHPARVRRHIGVAGQQVSLDKRQTGLENLVMLGRLSGLGRRAAHDRAHGLLDEFDLGVASERLVETYSGGMGRRLDLAAALIGRPQVLFLDEPTTGLDPRSRTSLWEVIRRIVAEGSSVFLTTQYLEEADQLASRVALVDGGRVVAEGTPVDLKRRVGQARLEFTLATGPDAVRAAEALDVVPAAELGTEIDREGAGLTVTLPTDGSVSHVRWVLERLEHSGVAPVSWAMPEPTLDDVFLSLTGHLARPLDAVDASAEPEEMAS